MPSVTHDLVPIAGGAVINADHASYDEAITHYQTSGIQGDWYLISDTKRLLRGVGSGAGGLLIPADLYALGTWAVGSNASGSFYANLDNDTLAALGTRGFVASTPTANASITKTAGNPVVMAYTTVVSGSESVNLDFTLTSVPTRGVLLFKLSALTGSGLATGWGFSVAFTDGTKEIKVGFNEGGTVGSIVWLDGTNADPDDCGTLTALTSGWVMVIFDKSNNAALCRMELLDAPAGRGKAIEYTLINGVTTTAGRIRFRVSRSAGAPAVSAVSASIDEIRFAAQTA